MTTVVPPRASPARHAAHRLTLALRRMGVWFWAIVVAAVVAGNVVGWATVGATDVSIASYARQACTWFPFSVGAMIVQSYLRVHVAAGMTRRSFVRAALAVQVGAGLVYAALLTVLVVAERAVHDALGWGSAITEMQVADESSPVWGLFLDEAVTFVLGNVAGLLVGIAYQRFGSWWGTLLLPLTVGPLALTLYVGGARLVQLPGPWTTAGETQFFLMLGALGTAMCLVTALAFALVARHAPVAARG